MSIKKINFMSLEGDMRIKIFQGECTNVNTWWGAKEESLIKANKNEVITRTINYPLFIRYYRESSRP